MPPKIKTVLKAKVMDKHIVRAGNGKLIEIPLTRKTVMDAMCMECMGWTNPVKCPAKLCPLYPFRRRSERTMRGTIERKPGEYLQG
jgi:hypothetical protein